WDGGFVGALATAAADTWATEIGVRLGGRPRQVTTFAEVDAGVSGGITLHGSLGSVTGALLVGTCWRLCGGDAAGPRTALAAGVAGALLDSLLGATVQAMYRCRQCGA